MELTESVDCWRNAADEYAVTLPSLSAICRMTAMSLELERITGVPYCSCCLVKLVDCKRWAYVNSQRRRQREN